MRRKGKQRIIIMVLTASMYLSGLPVMDAYAATTKEKLEQAQKENEETKNKLNETQSNIASMEEEKSGLQSKLNQLNKDLTAVSEKLADLEQQIKDKEEEIVEDHMTSFGMEHLGSSLITHEETRKELVYMLALARNNVSNAFGMYLGNGVTYDSIHEQERLVDKVNKEITQHITKAMLHENNAEGAYSFTEYFSMASDIERISDHALNIAGYLKTLTEKELHLSEIAIEEIKLMQKTCDDMFDVLLHEEQRYDIMYETVSGYEQKIDDMTKEYRNNMFERIRSGSCSDETSVLFSQILTDFERI